MQAGMASIGIELPLGETVNTNAAYLASRLFLLGLDLQAVIAVPDRMKSLVKAFDQARQCSEVASATSGLGPTQGDSSRVVITQVLGR